MKKRGVCSLRHSQLAERAWTGKDYSPSVVPALTQHESNYSIEFHPMNIKGGVAFKQKRTIQCVAGTGGSGWLAIAPRRALLNNGGGLINTEATHTATTFDIATVGASVTRGGVAPLSPYAAQVANFHLDHLCVSMVVNSSSVTDRKGRVHIGYSGRDNTSGWTGSQFAAAQSFNTQQISDLDSNGLPRYTHIPAALSFYPDTTADWTIGSELVVVFFEGVTSGTIFQFELSVAGTFFHSLNVPYETPIVTDTGSIECVASCLSLALPKGNAFQKRQTNQVKKRVDKELDKNAVTTTSFLGSLWDGAKWLWNHGGSSLLETAIGAIF